MEEGKTGLFFENQTVEDIVDTVKRFKVSDYDPNFIREKSKKFDKKLFKDRIKNYVEERYREHKKLQN
jgi:hypothetical protein